MVGVSNAEYAKYAAIAIAPINKATCAGNSMEASALEPESSATAGALEAPITSSVKHIRLNIASSIYNRRCAATSS
jgi:hypothetical protein